MVYSLPQYLSIKDSAMSWRRYVLKSDFLETRRKRNPFVHFLLPRQSWGTHVRGIAARGGGRRYARRRFIVYTLITGLVCRNSASLVRANDFWVNCRDVNGTQISPTFERDLSSRGAGPLRIVRAPVYPRVHVHLCNTITKTSRASLFESTRPLNAPKPTVFK